MYLGLYLELLGVHILSHYMGPPSSFSNNFYSLSPVTNVIVIQNILILI